MITYKEIRKDYKTTFGKTIKDCWIADVKRELKLTKRIAYNRISSTSVKYPCPDKEIKERIKKIILASLN